jgi:hypothetical protein
MKHKRRGKNSKKELRSVKVVLNKVMKEDSI